MIILPILLGLNACTSAGISSTATPPPTTTSAHPKPTLTQTSRVTATPSEEQVSLIATVWESDPLVPILTYHRFKNDNPDDVSDNMKMKYSDFRAQLQALYDAGYSLVPLEAWIKGDLSAPAGRIPLVFTLDDLYFADQLFLNEDGTPSNRSGMGILWEFYQEHPDFGYTAALFYNLGDKLYANHATTTWFIETEGWEEALAEAIVWGIDHDLMPYNHFYTHPRLSKLDGPSMLNQYQRNEKRMQQLLTLAGRPELFEKLGNMIALTYGQWPGTHYMNDFILGMPSLTRKPLLAVFEIDFAFRPKYMPAPYSEDFDRYHMPRIVANADALELLLENKDQFPVAGQCDLGQVGISQAEDLMTVSGLMRLAIQSGDCNEGVYALNGRLFRIQAGIVEEIIIPEP
ncbi:MAG: hypothetical protein JW704_01580 [Anaerolineaceae bacterium]|nr:hypothetical protein [Anaerolineaceae bacterium]MBN2677956.1 hypothetical protein [Anaerolineaceae bacterium]